MGRGASRAPGEKATVSLAEGGVGFKRPRRILAGRPGARGATRPTRAVIRDLKFQSQTLRFLPVSIRLEMLQVARLAPKMLGESAGLVQKFFASRQNPDGGFPDRSGASDLYYTVFGIEGLLALQMPLDTSRARSFLESFGTGDGLDFVHLCCLIRCHAALAGQGALSVSNDWLATAIASVEKFRCPDGGYNVIPNSPCGTAYGSFLAVAAYQDLRLPVPEPLRLVQSLKFLETPDGGWANERSIKMGSTNATAAATTLLLNLSMPVQPAVGDWLLARRHAEGGFNASPVAPMPDLLSTATTLHALSGLQRDFGTVKEPCLDFIDTLWTNEGGFHGHWGDDALDCEYTYYGLLALGHLSL